MSEKIVLKVLLVFDTEFLRKMAALIGKWLPQQRIGWMEFALLPWRLVGPRVEFGLMSVRTTSIWKFLCISTVVILSVKVV
jgi:hypothetical protein